MSEEEQEHEKVEVEELKGGSPVKSSRTRPIFEFGEGEPLVEEYIGVQDRDSDSDNDSDSDSKNGKDNADGDHEMVSSNSDSEFSQVQFPLTQGPTNNQNHKPHHKNSGSRRRSISSSDKKLMEQAELSRRVFLYLIEKYNQSPSIILYALYINCGNVDACEDFLSDPCVGIPWNIEEDHVILADSDVSEIIREKGIGGLTERRTFLHQVCEEAMGTLTEISTKLK